uniref:Uncharacterized protein n=1 Tax=viral metagenome TaxID=1070528 RepID=A0A6C0EUZ1_9ZZZZ
MSNILSIYIPRMSANVTEESIYHEFDYSVGFIERIDFVPIGKKTPGFTEENTDAKYKSAFIHFYNSIPEKISAAFEGGKSYKFQPKCTKEYWFILPNKNPIKTTMMNKTQIVENCRYLENKIEEQQETIAALEQKLEGVHQVVYQLLGGVFNQTTQAATLSTYLNELFPSVVLPPNEEEDISHWNAWPTTRQGDECERRIAAIEKQMHSMMTSTKQPDVVSHEESITDSTHSSMPGLIEEAEYEQEEGEEEYEEEEDDEEEYLYQGAPSIIIAANRKERNQESNKIWWWY